MKKEVRIESVKRETRKALLVVIEGNEFWIQKRWLRADNTLTPAGVKNYEEEMKKNERAGVSSSQERYNNEQNEIVENIANADYATEKAVMFKNVYRMAEYDHVREIEVHYIVTEIKWIPKSACEADGGIKRKVWNKFEWKVDSSRRARNTIEDDMLLDTLVWNL